MKTRIKNYLSITQKEWNGLIILVVFIVAVLCAPYLYQTVHKDKLISFKDFEAAAKQLKQDEKSNTDIDSDEKIANPVMFTFNPNQLPAGQWLKLGLSEHQVKTIKNYEAKGGKFRSKEDVKKIYAITAADYQRLEPYINLPSRGDDDQEKTLLMVELNAADSAQLTHLKGIGPAFALRISRYRDRLGGFYKKEQLKEVFGIDSVKYHDLVAQLQVDARRITKININKITFNELQLFPYLNYKQANAIVEYRTQHGDYSRLADLKNIAIIDDGILRKIEPYIVFK